MGLVLVVDLGHASTTSGVTLPSILKRPHSCETLPMGRYRRWMSKRDGLVGGEEGQREEVEVVQLEADRRSVDSLTPS